MYTPFFWVSFTNTAKNMSTQKRRRVYKLFQLICGTANVSTISERIMFVIGFGFLRGFFFLFLAAYLA